MIFKKKIQILSIADNDENINYQKSSIINDIYSNVSLSELSELFKICPEYIFKFSCRHISLILNDNNEIPLSKYKEGDKPIFLKITDDVLSSTGNDILIACQSSHFISNSAFITNGYHLFNPENKDIRNIPGASYHYAQYQSINGYKNTVMALAVRGPEEGSAYDYCYRQFININGSFYQGYLPAMDQMKLIIQNDKIINYIFEQLGFKPLSDYIGNSDIWTSSEMNMLVNFCFHSGECMTALKDKYKTVLPIFKFIV